MVYSLHLLCLQSQATSIPGIEHESLILNSLYDPSDLADQEPGHDPQHQDQC